MRGEDEGLLDALRMEQRQFAFSPKIVDNNGDEEEG